MFWFKWQVISPVTWLLSYSKLYHMITVISLALFICEMIEYACAGCPNLDRTQNEDGNVSLGFKMKNTPLGRREKKEKKKKPRTTTQPKPEKVWIPALSQLFYIYSQAYAECFYKTCLNRKLISAFLQLTKHRFNFSDKE